MKMTNLNIFLANRKHKLRLLDMLCFDKFKTIFNFKCLFFFLLKIKLEEILEKNPKPQNQKYPQTKHLL